MSRIFFFCLLLFVSHLSAQISFSISGNAHRSNDTPLEGVEVHLYHYQDEILIATTTTDNSGNYIFENVPAGEDYSIYASYFETDATEVTVYDFIRMQTHILGISPLFFQGQLASDVNHSHNVTAFDMVEERKRILLAQYDNTDVQEWVFIPSYYYIPNQSNYNPWFEDSPFVTENLPVINNLNADVQFDFVGIKVGDPSDGNEVILPAELTLNTPDVNPLVGENFSIPVTVSDFNYLAGLQFTLGWDANKMELQDLELTPILVGLDTHNNIKVHADFLNFFWTSNNLWQGTSLPDETVLITLNFNAVASGPSEITFENMQAVKYEYNVYEVASNSPDLFVSCLSVPLLDAVFNAVICAGLPLEDGITFSSPVTTQFEWHNDHPEIGLPASGFGYIPEFVPANTTLQPTTATITAYAIHNDCYSDPVVFTITVNPQPQIDPVNDIAVCNGDATAEVVFSGNVPGYDFQWQASQNTVGIAGSGTGNLPSFEAFNISQATQSVTVKAKAVNGFGCGSVTEIFNINVYPTPKMLQPASINSIEGIVTGPVVFTGAGPGAIYHWTNSEPAIGIPAAGTGNIGSFLAANGGNEPLTATITVVPEKNGCFGNPKIFTITVEPVLLQGPGEEGFSNDPIGLNASPNLSLAGDVYPNPFQNKTALVFYLPQQDGVQLKVWNETGTQVLERTAALEAGMNTFELDFTTLPEGGILFYRLESGSGSISGKLVRE